MKEIVIAAYDKDLSWVSELNNDVKFTIYTKGDILNIGQKLPNVGRCVHTFFRHIYENYGGLSDYTFFVQDYPFDHWENVVELINTDTFKQNCKLNINDYYYGFHYNTIGMPNRNSKYNLGGGMWTLYRSDHVGIGEVLKCYSNGHPQDYNPNINIDKYWPEFFEGQPPPIYEFIPGGHFCLTKEGCFIRSKDFYKKVIHFLETVEIAPWIIERLECYIFNKKFKSIL